MGLLQNWSVLSAHLVEAEGGTEDWGLPGVLASRISSGYFARYRQSTDAFLSLVSPTSSTQLQHPPDAPCPAGNDACAGPE
ncbi:hypothetical protein Naga_100648g2 [Nannochloropsis gaditana]|uniref:Uncharacterized protein n=1 Tax=Nannochloropsis gaditana TaxID=72520 RepID=W7TMQ7_9STRA|nr:hypothetical protein Naga_100648g2 [Nannochloropsis gaditana]